MHQTKIDCATVTDHVMAPFCMLMLTVETSPAVEMLSPDCDVLMLEHFIAVECVVCALL
jgi:hypothetical protein